MHNPKIDKEKFIVGTIAELHHIKGLDILIESAKEFKKDENIQFVIVGEGQIRLELEQKIQSLELQNKVILLGFLDKAAEYLKAFDLFVLPSRSEALALVILEAGLAQIPVIASRVGGIPEVVLNDKFGKLFDSENILQLTELIKSSVDNYEEARQTAVNLNTRIKDKFSHQQMLDKTIELY